MPRPNSDRLIRSRSAGWLTAVVAVLIVAFIWLPARLAGASSVERTELGGAAGRAIVQYWHTGRRTYPPSLAELVDYWRRYHIVKAMVAAALLITLCALAKIQWRSVLAEPGGRGSVAAFAGLATSCGLAFGSSLLILANIQGAVAPLSSLLSTLPLGHDPAVDDTASAIHHALGGRVDGQQPLGRMVADFGRYHAVLAAGAALLSVWLVGSAISALRRSKPGVLQRSRTWIFATLAVVMLVVCVANAVTASNPAPALRLLFGS